MVNEHLQTEGLWHWVNIDPEKPCLVAWLIFQARKCYVNLPWIIIIEPLTLPLSHLILLVGLKRFSNPINPIIIPSKSGSIIRYSNQLPGKQPHNYGKSPFLMGKLTISMAIFQFAFCMFTRPGFETKQWWISPETWIGNPLEFQQILREWLRNPQ